MGRREDIEARMRALEAEHARLSRFPATDVFADGTIMAWQTRTRETTYNYAAIRGNDLWWSTGPVTGGQRSRSYDELLTFIGDGTNVRVIDPDVGLELDQLVIERGDDDRPWRNRFQEQRNAAADQLSDATAAQMMTANPPAEMIMRGNKAAGPPTYETFPVTEEMERFAREALLNRPQSPESER